MRTTRSIALFLTQLGAPQVGDECECHATNARYNVSSQPRAGYDFIPVVADDSLGFYVVYSAKQDESGTGIASTACIYVLPLANEEVLLFGAGWGDSSWAGWALHDADYDVAHVDQVIRTCLGLDPARARLRFAAPHGHPDHVNAAFVKSLERAGYVLAEIAFHEDDRDPIESMPWYPHQEELFHVLAGLPCGRELASYASPLGRLWLTSRPGHTPGAIDLVLDVSDDPEVRVLVRGSLAGGGCPDPPGVVLDLDAHGTAILAASRRAQLEVLEGRGLNRPCLTAARPPRLGTTWTADIEASAHPGATLVYLFATDCRLDPGRVGDYGELLVDPGGRPIFALWQPSSGPTDSFSIPIPNDPILMGLVAYAQATILGGIPELCNGLELVIGF